MSDSDLPVPAIRHRPREAGRPIFGLVSAIESFNTAYLRHVAPAPVTVLTRTEADFARIRSDAGAAGIDAARLQRAPIGDHVRIAAAGALLWHDPTLVTAARARPDPRAYSLIGVTHSLSSRESWQEIQAYPTAPLQPWDALVCTTRVARDVVDALLDDVEDAARRAGHAGPVPRPERPIIPLGIDARALARDGARRARWRARLAMGADECVLLCLGRLSIHAKAHPFAMFAAIAEAAASTGRRLRLVLLGQAAKPSIASAYREAADRFAASVPVDILDGPSDDDRADALSGADVFISLADSIQETFGLAPVEAMAASLPAIVTDWNGYRDTVRHEIDGYRIPTLMASPPAAARMAETYLAGKVDYDRFCGATNQLVAVDVRAAAAAIVALADADRRQAMGEAAAARARAAFDWPVVLDAYRDLWRMLAERRRTAPIATPVPAAAPPAPDPLRLFASFPTRLLATTDRIAFRVGRAGALLAETHRSAIFRYAFHLLPAMPAIAALLDRIAAAPGLSVADLLTGVGPDDRPAALRLVLLLAKRDLLTVTPAMQDSRQDS